MKFLKTLLASVLGVFIAFGLLVLIFFLIIASSSQEPEPYIRDSTVLEIDISGSLPARVVENPFDELFNPADGDRVSLESLRNNLEKAASHDNIKGVLLRIDMLSEQWANLEEARDLIHDFKADSDKFVYATTNDMGYNEAGYFLATAADSVFSPPESFFEFDGFFLQSMFYSGLMEKLGIEAEVTRLGRYKGAVEPFTREDLSEDNEVQLQAIVDRVSQTFTDAVEEKTGKSAEVIDELMNDTPDLRVKRAHEEGLVDELLYEEDLENLIKQRLGLEEDAELQTVSSKRYSRVTRSTAGLEEPDTDDEIAVLYADGPIVYGIQDDSPFSNQPMITASFFEEQLEKIREDEDIKGLVVRVNSPGGSGSTSDAIWHMLRETSEEIPVIASMGPTAASGGYYIAMAADTIVSDPTTITGSIGVFATKFNTQELFNEELGITFDEVKSHDHADWLTSSRGFTEEEAGAFQQFVEDFYEVFISRVAESRDMSTEQVDEVGQGRVWTGADALEQGLVDELGGLETALDLTAEKAGIESYHLRVYPQPKGLFEMFAGSAEAKVHSLLGGWLLPETAKLKNDFSAPFKKHRGEAMLLYPWEFSIQ